MEAHRGQRVIGGRGPWLSDIVNMLRTTSPEGVLEYSTLLCIDTRDEYVEEHLVKLANSLS